MGHDEIQYLASGLKDTQVTTVKLSYTSIINRGIDYFTNGLKHNQISTLDLGNNSIGDQGIQCLTSGLKYTLVTTLDLRNNNIGDPGIQYLASVLKDTMVTTLYLQKNKIGDEGVKHLANNLKDTHVGTLELGSNKIGNEGVKYIAGNLKESWITTLSLSTNRFKNEGAEYLANAIKNSQVTVIDLCAYAFKREIACHIETLLEENKKHISKICEDFKLLVSKDSGKDPLVFQVHSPADGDQCIDIEKYLTFIKSIHDMPRFIPHLINDPDIIYTRPEIEQFMQNISIQFSEFLGKVLDGDHSEYVNLLKRCEDMHLDFLIKDLLLNRGACTIEASRGDVLYPYVYVLLKRYNQPLLAKNSAFKCNKREIIEYFQNHPELEYRQEAIECLDDIDTCFKKRRIKTCIHTL